MSRTSEITTNQRNFLHHALKNQLRLNSPTNRSFFSHRPISIRLSSEEYGYVEVSWGQTKLSVRVSAQIVKPYADRPFEGIFTINSEISPQASLKFDTTRAQQQDEILVSRILEKAIRRSNAVDLESLCIVAGDKVWELVVDLNFWNYDGNLIDVGCFATMLALLHFRKPDISINGDAIVVHDESERQPVSLSVLHIPICLTFSFYNLSSQEMNIKGGGASAGGRDDSGVYHEGDENEDEICLFDADALEESLRQGSLTITLNKNREIIQLSKNGGVPIDAQQLLNLCFESVKIVDELTELIKVEIKQHEEMRYKKENFKLLESSANR
ncbi:RRP45 [Candida margitis]|uniref:RRP45 n=1 Tax=Candida margitis TaxID=1775924 RepID=UPI002226B86B|nr:RRP45 [Candida margitis]KAI5970636.1 RRP45 [Candida margitis]